MKLIGIGFVPVLALATPLLSEQARKAPAKDAGKKRIELFVDSPTPGYCSKKLEIVDPVRISEFEKFLRSSSKDDSDVMPCGYDVKVLFIENVSDTNEVLINSECGYMRDSKGIVGQWKKYNGALDSDIEKARQDGKPAKVCWNG